MFCECHTSVVTCGIVIVFFGNGLILYVKCYVMIFILVNVQIKNKIKINKTPNKNNKFWIFSKKNCLFYHFYYWRFIYLYYFITFQGPWPPPPLTFLLSKKNKKTVNWKINKKHEIVKRSHQSTCSGSRKNHRTLIYEGKKSQLHNSVFNQNKPTLFVRVNNRHYLNLPKYINQHHAWQMAWCALY